MPEFVALKVKELYTDQILDRPNVIGTGVGRREVDGIQKPAVIVFVEEKMNKDDVITKYSAAELIPEELDGIPTKVIEVGKVVKQGFSQRIRPIQPGYSVGHQHITAGTIGGFFRDKDGDVVALTNNHVGACFDDQTEVLTREGFKLWQDVQDTDEFATLNTGSGYLEYQKSTRLHAYPYSGNLISFSSKYIDLMVTPNHDMLCREDYRNNSKTSEYQKVKAELIEISGNKTIRIPRACSWAGEEIKTFETKDQDAWLGFMGLYLAEGSTTYSPPYIRHGKMRRGEEFITSVRNKDISVLRACSEMLTKAGFKNFINEKSWYCRSYDKRLYDYLKQFGKSHEKHVPLELKQLPPKKLDILFNWCSVGDGTTSKRSKAKGQWHHRFTFKSNRLRDDMLEIALKLGKTGVARTINGSTFNPFGTYYQCELVESNLEPKVRNRSLTHYNGIVYCATVPNGTLLVRRNGKIAWCGNCENKANIGDIIYQPGPMDAAKGSVNFTGWNNPASSLAYFGTLKRFIPLTRANNQQDSAIIKVHQSFLDSNLVNPVYPQLNKPMVSFNTASIGMRVQKCGRTTGYTTGSVVALHASFTISYDFGAARFNDCIVCSGMSQGGDSGSLIMDENMNAVALLFAGSDKVTLANPINYVVNEYGLVPYTSDQKPQSVDTGVEWRLKSSNGIISATDSTLQVDSKEFSSCYVEKAIDNFNLVMIKIQPLTDLSNIYGPGMAIIHGDKFIKINLCKNGIQGCANGNPSFVPMHIDGDREYMIRFKKENGKIKGSVYDGNTFIDVLEAPSIDGPATWKIGKMNAQAADGHEADLGTNVSCFFSDPKVS